MNPKISFYHVTRTVPNTIVFSLILIQSRVTHLIDLAKKVFGLVFYGLTVINSTMQVVLFSLRIIATYQVIWEQVINQDNIRNGGVVVLNKQYFSEDYCDASRKHYLLSQFGG